MTQHILVVEADAFSRSLIAGYLETQNFRVTSTDSGTRALAVLEADHVDLVLLDFGLPDMRGAAALKRIRARSTKPVIITSNTTSSDSRIDILDAGADDVLEKPFHPKEMVSRIKAVLRRGHSGPALLQEITNVVYVFDGWRLRSAGRDLLSPQDVSVPLTPAEFNLLSALLRSPLHVLTREELLDSITRGDDAPVDRSIDVLVSRVRRKIEANPRKPRYIQTVQSFGYRFNIAVVEERGRDLVRPSDPGGSSVPASGSHR